MAKSSKGIFYSSRRGRYRSQQVPDARGQVHRTTPTDPGPCFNNRISSQAALIDLQVMEQGDLIYHFVLGLDARI